MPIVSLRGLPEDFKTKCCDCGEEISHATIKGGQYAHIVKAAGKDSVLRCELCQEDHDEKFGGDD